MADILPFVRKKRSVTHKGNTLCRNGHHKWRIKTANRFDVKQGKLVTQYECIRCGKEKTKSH